jgi:hypothetical protein
MGAVLVSDEHSHDREAFGSDGHMNRLQPVLIDGFHRGSLIGEQLSNK